MPARGYPMRAFLRSGALVAALLLTAVTGAGVRAQQPVTLTVDVDRPGVRIDPAFYGLMTEEINFSYYGGLYAELIRNRTFRDDPAQPVHWSLVKDGSAASITLDHAPVPGTALTTALKLEVPAGSAGRAGAANEGYWGIPVRPATTYRLSFWAKAARA